jgi:hypothetical protein
MESVGTSKACAAVCAARQLLLCMDECKGALLLLILLLSYSSVLQEAVQGAT